MSVALGDCGIPINPDFSGIGIKVGILENKLPYHTANFEGTTIVEHGTTRVSAYELDHPYEVASILGGKNGIAKGASLHFVAKVDYENQLQAIEELVSDGVNIINQSGAFNCPTGYYNSYSAYIDRIAKTQHIIFVNALGNDGENAKIPVPATGLNVIAVGASTREKRPAFFNNRGVDDPYSGILFKPTLLAPGSKLMGVRGVCDGVDDDDLLSGASFSSPFVAGAIALLMQEFPTLKSHPEMIVPLLCSSCSRASGQTTEFDLQNGFGILNYEHARMAFPHCDTISLPASETAFRNVSFSLSPNQSMSISAFVLFNCRSVGVDGLITQYYPADLPFSSPRIDLIDSSGLTLKSGTQLGPHYECFYRNDTSQPLLLTMKISATSSSGMTESELIGYSCFLSQDEIVFSCSIANSHLDTLPTFSWQTSQGTNYFSHPIVDFFISNFRGQTIIQAQNLSSNGSHVLTKGEWSSIINLRGREYYCYFSIHNIGATLPIHYSPLFLFEEPTDFATMAQIKPADWGFEPRYFFLSDGIKTLNLPTPFGLNISTARLRCGYIESEYINLSPKREGAGSAYFEMHFDRPVYSYMVGLAFWSASELLFPNDGDTCKMETLQNNGVWVEELDLLSDVILSTDRTHVDRFSFQRPEGIFGLRFISSAKATGTRNKGRLCIDDIVLNTDPNQEGFYSTFYESNI
jgi:hypothetical protein